MLNNTPGHTDHGWNIICDICGRKRKNSEVTLAYGTGDIAVVVSCIDECADYRHPLNSPPPLIFDAQPVPDARPDVGVNLNQYLNPITSLYRVGYLPFGYLGYWDTGINTQTFNIPLVLGLFNQDPNQLTDPGDSVQG